VQQPQLQQPPPHMMMGGGGYPGGAYPHPQQQQPMVQIDVRQVMCACSESSVSHLVSWKESLPWS
jgi:hypothetical protein